MDIKTFFDSKTSTLTYLVFDKKTNDAVLIDPVMDYDSQSSTVSFESSEPVVDFIKESQLNLHYVLETHVHADHLSGASVFLKTFPNAKSGISERVKEVSSTFQKTLGFEASSVEELFDCLIKDKEVLSAGSLQIQAIATPGHTPACMCFLIGDNLFTGDTLFMPDFGTGRCDFPGGSAKDLYKSIRENIYTLPEETKIFVGHDYQPGGRPLQWESTVAEQKESNIHISLATNEEDFLNFRVSRDKTLKEPKLLNQSMTVNLRGGRIPKANSEGRLF